MHTCTYAHMHAGTHVHMHTRAHILIHASMHNHTRQAHVPVHTTTLTHVCIHASTQAHACTNTHARIHTHTHTHTNVPKHTHTPVQSQTARPKQTSSQDRYSKALKLNTFPSTPASGIIMITKCCLIHQSGQDCPGAERGARRCG